MEYIELITDAEINEVQETPELNSLIQYLQKVYYYAQSRDQYNEKTNYKWILGARIIYMLEWMSKRTLLLINRDQPSTLFGIVVERDFQNPERIELWENITDKLF